MFQVNFQERSKVKKTNIILSGEGGQGIQTITKIFTNAAYKSGLDVAYIPSFGVEQRGTPSMSFVTIDSSPLRYPKFAVADYVIILQNRAVEAVTEFISPNTKVIFDPSTINSNSLPKTAIHLFGIPATLIATSKFHPKSFNIIVLGYLTKIFDLKPETVFDEMLLVLGKKIKNKEMLEENKEAFFTGLELIPERSNFTKAVFKPKHRSILVKGHNKSGEILPSRCKGCGICIAKCPVAALSFGDELGVFATPVPKIDLERCIACGNCRNFCPDSAISINKDTSN